MGLCIGRPRDGDFTGWCERHEEAIIQAVEDRHALEDGSFDWNDLQCQSWFDEEANKLWEDCADCDPRGGDGEDD